MEFLGIDAETYYDKDYSLRKISTQDYIMSEQFELMCISLKRKNQKALSFTGAQWPSVAERIDWDKVALVCHNTMFDGAILAWRYGIKPRLYIDTMSMAQPQVSHITGSVSLAKLAQHYGLQAKGGFLQNVMGRRWHELSPNEQRLLRKYCCGDNEICMDLLDILIPNMPRSELDLIDLTMRMFIEGDLVLNADILRKHLLDVRLKKQALLDRCGLADRSVLMSNEHFGSFLELFNIPVPMKQSPSNPAKMIPALAKTDKQFTDLLEHPNEEVQAWVAARLGHKSTIEETRTEKLLGIADKYGTLPVPLRYYAAHTGRYGGTGKINVQNLPVGSPIRYSIEAKPGYKIIVVDASQIEARFLAWWAKQDWLVEAFREGRDVYSEFATSIYGYPVNKDDYPDERFVGKVGILSLGYGAAGLTFHNMLRTKGVKVEPHFANRVVGTYRERNKRIRNLWYRMGDLLPFMATARGGQTEGVFEIRKEQIVLPNGMSLWYPGLHRDDDTGDWFYINRTRKKLYGAKTVENACQAATRIHITNVMSELRRRGYHVRMQVHDEIIMHEPDFQCAAALNDALELLSTPPDWAPGLPLAAEGKIAGSYGAAK